MLLRRTRCATERYQSTPSRPPAGSGRSPTPLRRACTHTCPPSHVHPHTVDINSPSLSSFGEKNPGDRREEKSGIEFPLNCSACSRKNLSQQDFVGGLYHGRIVLPVNYPLSPPSIIMLNDSGRFEKGKKICLSMSFQPAMLSV